MMKEIDQEKLDAQSKGLMSTLGGMGGSTMKGIREAVVVGVLGATTLTAAAAGLNQVVDVSQALGSAPAETVHMHAESLASQDLDPELTEQIQKAAEDSAIDVTVNGENHLEVSIPAEVINGDMAIPSDIQSSLVDVTQSLDGHNDTILALEGHTDVPGAGPLLTDHQIVEVEDFMKRVASSQDMELGAMVPVSLGSSQMDEAEQGEQGPRVDLQVLSGEAAQQYMDEVAANEMTASGPSL